MNIQQITATEMTRHLSDILNRTYYQGQSFDIKRGKEIIAKLIPGNAAGKVQMPICNLNAFFSSLPPLDREDSLQWENDLHELRHHLPMEGDKWES